MLLQTHIPLYPEKNQISYDKRILMLGSCFVENIGKKLKYFKFSVQVNPFGILFHPKAILNLLERAEQKRSYTENDIFFLNERWHSYEAHSDLSGWSKQEVLEGLNKALQLTLSSLSCADFIVITSGTAWAYQLKNAERVVANCHKVPQNEFDKVLWPVEQLEDCYKKILKLIKRINPNARIVFTVSPVRHLKDGFVENQQSKAHLMTATHLTISAAEPSFYFPAYEIMMDELRDYRFYTDDMVHPNAMAVSYIWEKFKKVWVDPKSYQLMDEIDKIQKGLNHKPFNPESEQHRSFRRKLQHRIDRIKEQYPEMVF